ncbi:hypothetical protein NPIL_377061, partial [Nephila pilipes]
YLEHANCFENIYKDFGSCETYARNRVNLFDVSTRSIQSPGYFSSVGKVCVGTSFKAYCAGTRILDTCGEDAFNLFKEMFEGSKIYSNYCQNVEYRMAEARVEIISRRIKENLIED